MRVLLYGMQSSGASLLALALAQKKDSAAFVDIWNMFAAPSLETGQDAVAKVVVTTSFCLKYHQRRFRPDVTILVLRHPVDTHDSLYGRTYANESGLIDEKFAVLEEVFRTGNEFDHIVLYEDFVFSPRTVIEFVGSIGWRIGYDALLFRRTQGEIQEANAAACPELHGRLKYGGGNVQIRQMRRDRIRLAEPSDANAHLLLLCPRLFEHYSALRAERGSLWHVPTPALLSCSLGSIVRALTNLGTIPEHAELSGYLLRFVNGTKRCKVVDGGISLFPPNDGRETELTISRLPGQAFNRFCGIVYAEDPRALGTHVRVRLENGHSECIGEREFTLCHADSRSIDFHFEPQDASLSLSMGVRLASGVSTAAHAGVRFQGLRLEQVAV